MKPQAPVLNIPLQITSDGVTVTEGDGGEAARTLLSVTVWVEGVGEMTINLKADTSQFAEDVSFSNPRMPVELKFTVDPDGVSVLGQVPSANCGEDLGKRRSKFLVLLVTSFTAREFYSSVLTDEEQEYLGRGDEVGLESQAIIYWQYKGLLNTVALWERIASAHGDPNPRKPYRPNVAKIAALYGVTLPPL
jgi:hypothetical protein